MPVRLLMVARMLFMYAADDGEAEEDDTQQMTHRTTPDTRNSNHPHSDGDVDQEQQSRSSAANSADSDAEETESDENAEDD